MCGKETKYGHIIFEIGIFKLDGAAKVRCGKLDKVAHPKHSRMIDSCLT